MAQFWFAIFTIGFFLSALATLGNGSEEEPEFNYDTRSLNGPYRWGSVTPAWEQCQNGRRQSPIRIKVPATFDNSSLGKLDFESYPSEGVLINNGHSVDVALGPQAGRLVLGEQVYELQSFHFHAPSEHVIGHTRFPLEMHLVHRTADEKLAVIGIVFSVGEKSKFLEQIDRHLGEVTEKDSNTSIGLVGLRDLDLGITYARYQGSLTTPPCTEGVTWTVALSQENTLSQAQLDSLENIMRERNARPLQRRMRRKVERFSHPNF